MYFRGLWRIPFDKKDSYVDKFILPNGETTDVENMYLDHFLTSVLTYPSTKSIQLFLGNGKFYLDIILPDRGTGIDELIDNIDISKEKGFYGYRDLELSIPKISLNTLYVLNDVLQSFGIEDIFKMGAADFSPMLQNVNTSEIYLGDIRQGCGFSIDEKGVKASSATSGVVMDGCALEEPEIMIFKVNRPFLFVLKEFSSRSVLLVGKISIPEVSKE